MSAKGQEFWWWVLLAMLAAAGFFFLTGLGQMPLTDRDEGEYAASVAAMFARGDFIVPTLNGQPYLEKPILLFWLIAIGQAILGPGELAARLPSALASVGLMLWLGWLLITTTRNPAFTVLALAAAAFTPLMALVGRACLTDLPLTLFTTLCLGAFFIAGEKEGQGGRWWWLVGWAGLGLGFLTKGPVAPAVVLPTFLIYAALQRRLWATLKSARVHWGLVIFVAINLPWYGLVFWRMGDEFWRAFFVSQNLRRFSEVLLGHGGGFFYYLPVVLLGFWPFSAAALPGLGAALFRNRREARAADALARLRLLAGVAVVVVLVVFSLAATKQINYIMPAWPWLAVLAGYQLWRLMSGEPGGRLARGIWSAAHWGLGGVWTLALIAVPVALSLAWPRIVASIRPDSSEYALPPEAPLLLLWPLACGLIAAAAVWLPIWLRRKSRPREAALALAAGAGLFCAAMAFGLLPRAAQEIQDPAKAMALACNQRLGNAANPVTFGLWKPSLLFYLDREVPRLRSNETEQMAARLAEAKPVVVLTRTSLADRLAATPGFMELGRWSGYMLGGNGLARSLYQGPGLDAPAVGAGGAKP